jgi:hypothetical protein
MEAGTPELGGAARAFAIAAATAILFNTVLACVKDAHKPLQIFMASLTGSDWTTQGIADVALFAFLGLILWKSNLTKNIRPAGIIFSLAGTTIIAGAGLFAWYALY